MACIELTIYQFVGTSQTKYLILNMYCVGIYVYCAVLFDVSENMCSCFCFTSEITPLIEKM